MRQGIVKIDESIDKNLSNYSLSKERENQLLLQKSANLIRGYGTQNQVEQYNKMSTQQQQSINQYIANQIKKPKKSIYAKDYDI